MHKHLLVIFFLGIALSINAQKTLRGKLIASDSKKPISGASVFCLDVKAAGYLKQFRRYAIDRDRVEFKYNGVGS